MTSNQFKIWNDIKWTLDNVAEVFDLAGYEARDETTIKIDPERYYSFSSFSAKEKGFFRRVYEILRKS